MLTNNAVNALKLQEFNILKHNAVRHKAVKKLNYNAAIKVTVLVQNAVTCLNNDAFT